MASAALPAETLLRQLRDACAAVIERTHVGTQLTDAVADASELCSAVEAALCAGLRKGASADVLWGFLSAIPWPGADAGATGKSRPSLQAVYTSAASSVLATSDVHRSRIWIRIMLNQHMLASAVQRMLGGPWLPTRMAWYDASAVLRDGDTADRLVTLLAAMDGLPFAFDVESLAMVDLLSPEHAAAAHATLHAPGMTAATDAAAVRLAHKLEAADTLASLTHPPVAAATSPAMHAATHSGTPPLQGVSTVAHPTGRPREWSISLVDAAVSALDRASAMLSRAPTPLAAAAPAASAAKPAKGGFFSLLSMLGSSASTPQQKDSSRPGLMRSASVHSSSFAAPLDALIHDPHHCVHALLDYRLSVPELVHQIARYLKPHLPPAASPAGLGIVAVPADRLYATVQSMDASGAPGDGAHAAVDDLYAAANVLVYFLLVLPDAPIPCSRFDTLMACATLPAGDVRIKNMRALVNDCPTPHKGILCEVVPLLAHMAGLVVDDDAPAVRGGTPLAGLAPAPRGPVRSRIDSICADDDLPVITADTSAASMADARALVAELYGSETPRRPASLRGVPPAARAVNDLSPVVDASLHAMAALVAPALFRPEGARATEIALISASTPSSSRAATAAADHSKATTGGIAELCSSVLAYVAHHERERMTDVAYTLLRHWDIILADALAERQLWHDALIARFRLLIRTHTAVVTTVDAATPMHAALLKRLWKGVAPVLAQVTSADVSEFQLESVVWRAIGFTRTSPLVDLEAASPGDGKSSAIVGGAGLLALQCLVYMCDALGPRMMAVIARLHGDRDAAHAWQALQPTNSSNRRPSALHGRAQTLPDPASRPASPPASTRAVDDDDISSPMPVASGRVWYPFASACCALVRRLADALHVTGAAVAVPPSDAADSDVQPRKFAFSPVIVATTAPDLWAITAFDVRDVAPSRAAADPASGVDATQEPPHISESFVRLACLAMLILDARWCARSNEHESMHTLLLTVVADTLDMLPSIAKDAVMHAAVEVDVLTLLGAWKRKTGVGLNDATLASIAAGAAQRADAPNRTAAAAPHPPRSRAISEPVDTPVAAQPRVLDVASANAAALAMDAPTPTTLLATSHLAHMPIESLPRPHVREPSAILSPHQLALLEACLPRSMRGYDWTLVYSLTRHGAALETLLSRCREHAASMVVIKDSKGCVFGGFASEPWAIIRGGSYYGNGQAFVWTFEPRALFDAWRTRQLDSVPSAAASVHSSRSDGDASGDDTARTTGQERAGETSEAAPTVEQDEAAVGDVTSPTRPLTFSTYRWTHKNRFCQLATGDGLGMGGGGHFAFFVDSDLCNGSTGTSATFMNPRLSCDESFTCIAMEVWAFARHVVV